MREREKMEKIEPASPFIDTRRGGVHVREGGRSRRSSPNRGRTVVNYCRKYAVGLRRSWRRACGCPGRCPGLAEIAPASLWLLRASWRLLSRVPSSVRDVAASRGSCRPESCSGQGPGCVRGLRPCCSRVPQWRKYEGSMRSWRHSGNNSAEHVGTRRRRFPQCRHSVRDGGAVTGVGGWDPGHSHCVEWWSDAI